MKDFSFLANTDPVVLEELWEKYLDDPSSVDESWQIFFAGMLFKQSIESEGETPTSNESEASCQHDFSQFEKEVQVLKLIEAYRQRGHLIARTNPLKRDQPDMSFLDIETFGLDSSDLGQVFQAGTSVGHGATTLKEIINHLKKTYCSSVGVEYRYIRYPEMVGWLQEKMEGTHNTPIFSKNDKERILKNLSYAVLFESFLDRKYIGQKRFSLEGLEALIPGLDFLIEKGSALGAEEFIIGMTHRGRLNVLGNILQKPYEELFYEFRGEGLEDVRHMGDVKYHQGFKSTRVTTSGKEVGLTLSVNPSHLEAVGTLVEGKTRARLDMKYDHNPDKVIPVLLHGDASISGQGVVYEILQMSRLKGYETGGTIHIVLNNQIGFTTSSEYARSSTYCTDVGKVTLSPVFHVNGDDVEAVVYVLSMAMEFRKKFHRDVFIDILGYRKHGHNEGDEPRFTQPQLYALIAKQTSILALYKNQLLLNLQVDESYPDQVEAEFEERLEKEYIKAQNRDHSDVRYLFTSGEWKDLRFAHEMDFEKSPETGIDITKLKSLVHEINFLPSDKSFLKKVKKIFSKREESALKNNKIDWGMGELLAYASLLKENFPVRVSGQDSGRGTFSHRHAILTHQDSEEQYIPLSELSKTDAPFAIYNSPLSEYGVLGFEFGYAYLTPYGLTVWEAQFGDFSNTAQVIFDQFIFATEAKWHKMNGLVVLLPHGLEGQGPEHSSARVERLLSLCAHNNVQITNCTTPANFFHVLRRQLYWPFRKPLIVLTPKSLLRHPSCLSHLEDFETGTAFKEVIDDPLIETPENVCRLIFCTGKIYYDLLARQKQEKIKDMAVIRLEQLYPIPDVQLEQVLSQYPETCEKYWVQEEPENMGAWSFIERKLKGLKLKGIYRAESSSPATGYHQRHQIEQNEIIDQAFQK